MLNNVILCIDHDALLLEVFSLVLLRDGYEVIKAETISAAAAAIQRQTPALILLDLDLGETLTVLTNLAPSAPVIVISTTEFDDRAQAAMAAGASGFIFKPALNLNKLREIIADYLPQKEQREVVI